MDDEEAYVSSAQSPAQRAVHVATRKPAKRHPAAAAAAAAAAVDGDVGTGDEVQRRLMIRIDV